MLDVIDLILGLLVGVAVLSALARRLHVPGAIVLVIGGALFGLIPGLPPVHLDPDLVFLFFLPPLLYPAALFTSWRDFRANLRPISFLAVGLVLFTTAAIAWLAHSVIGLPLAAGLCWAPSSPRPTRSQPRRLPSGCACPAASSPSWKARAW
jgi:CPA1 family monovalent cation:H+ antiporter